MGGEDGVTLMLLRPDSLSEAQALILDLKVGGGRLDMVQPLLSKPLMGLSPTLLTLPLVEIWVEVSAEEWEGALVEEWEGAGERDGGKSLTTPVLHASSIDEAWDERKLISGRF